MTSTPTPENIRLTITVTPEVHAAFQRISTAGKMSMSKAMGEWLADTLEAAEFMAEKMEQARAAPKVVMREMHSYALGLVEETDALMEQIRAKGRETRDAKRSAARGTVPAPPSGNTGGKGTKQGRPGANAK